MSTNVEVYFGKAQAIYVYHSRLHSATRIVRNNLSSLNDVSTTFLYLGNTASDSIVLEKLTLVNKMLAVA